jgi:hypothetical protein
MAEVKNKVVTVESLSALHDYDENTYLKTSGALSTLGITATAAELNILDGVTASATEINKLKGLTATTAELNYTDGVTSNIQTQLNGKAASSHIHDYLPLLGGTMSGDITFANTHGRIYATDYSKDSSGVVKEVLVGQTLDGNTSIGYGNYYEQSGSTNIYGDSITMTSRTAGLNEREYGVNKILWEGNLHMNGTQTITLLDTVFHQPNGIALVWSEYDSANNVVKNQGFITHFIPKILIALQPERFHSFPFMIWSHQTKQFAKGLYISDGSITGHSINTDSSDPAAPVNSYILRYVIGV